MILLHALLCGVIALRLLLFRRQTSTHRPLAAGLAYLIIVAAGSVPLRLPFDTLPPVDLAQLMLDVVLCLVVLSTRGNVLQLFRRDKPTRWSRRTWPH